MLLTTGDGMVKCAAGGQRAHPVAPAAGAAAARRRRNHTPAQPTQCACPGVAANDVNNGPASSSPWLVGEWGASSVARSLLGKPTVADECGVSHAPTVATDAFEFTIIQRAQVSC